MTSTSSGAGVKPSSERTARSVPGSRNGARSSPSQPQARKRAR